jgi:adenylylsulfate kinase-like enzyme
MSFMSESSQYERPFVLLLSGPAGAGKTTVARAWASIQQRPTAHISLDDVRDFVKSGYAHPPDGWNAAVEQQHHLARQGCATLALNYQN